MNLQEAWCGFVLLLDIVLSRTYGGEDSLLSRKRRNEVVKISKSNL